MTRLPLSRGLTAIVDDRDAWAASFTWHAAARGRVVYAARHVVASSGARTKRYLHREILAAPPGVEVDHLNLDGLDCRRENLRLADHAENKWNRGRNRNNTSGFKGVSWSARRRRWVAQIVANGTTTQLGYFDTVEAAARAYDAAARVLHREFARLNLPEGT